MMYSSPHPFHSIHWELTSSFYICHVVWNSSLQVMFSFELLHFIKQSFWVTLSWVPVKKEWLHLLYISKQLQSCQGHKLINNIFFINNDTCVYIKSYKKQQKCDLIITPGIIPKFGTIKERASQDWNIVGMLAHHSVTFLEFHSEKLWHRRTSTFVLVWVAIAVRRHHSHGNSFIENI